MSKIQIIYLLVLSAVAIVLLALLVVWFFILKPVDRELAGQAAKVINIDGNERHYRIFNASSGGEERPLVVLLHGFKDRAEWVGAYSGFNILAKEESFTLLLPQGFGLSWNAEVCCGPAFQRDMKDSKFIIELTTKIAEEYAIDNEKIYIVGFSNGGLMAQKIISEEPKIFSAAAVLMSGAGSELAILDISGATAPIMLINGDSDKYIALREDVEVEEAFSLTSVEETIGMWTKHYGAELTSTRKSGVYREQVYKNGEEVKVLHRLYFNQGHRWPQRRLWSFDYRVPGSTTDIWEFLDSF
ncbi:MAG: PHB depolymerase family esterase [Candidatus Spechtbacterales bacterium]|nr:PHB depolymerase family esterase [Candidatus Spechtbacterales bacterium]